MTVAGERKTVLFEGSSSIERCTVESPRFVPTLMEFAAPRSFVCGQVGILLGRSPSALTRPFQAGLAVCLLAVPRPLTAEAHPPSSFSAPSAFRPIACPPHRFERRSLDLDPGGLRAPSVGFRPSSRLQSITALAWVPIPHARVPPRVTPVGTCPFGPSVLGVSRALDGLLLQQASGPFQAGAVHGVFPSELCSSRTAARLSAPIPSCRS